MKNSDSSSELYELFRADYREHSRVPEAGTAKYAALRERDEVRRARALEVLSSIPNPTAQDLYHVAWLLNHGDAPDEARQAHRLAARAEALGYEQARWLSAASYDRWCMYAGNPQKYGTQIVPDGSRYRVWDTDPETTDAERAELGVPPLEAQHKRAEEMTTSRPQPPMNGAPNWLKSAIRRWSRERTHDA